MRDLSIDERQRRVRGDVDRNVRIVPRQQAGQFAYGSGHQDGSSVGIAVLALVDIRKRISGGERLNAGAIAVALVMIIGVLVQDAPPGSDDAPAAASTSDDAEPGQQGVPTHDPEQPGQVPEEPAHESEQPADPAM
jgi:hypothetical protein